MTTTNNYRGNNGIYQQTQLAAHHTINNHDKEASGSSLMHPISNNNRPNSSNMPYTCSHQQILETNLNHSKSNAANLQLFKNNHAGKPPKAINQSMQHVTKGAALISQELGHPNNTTKLDLSMDSISNRQATALLKHTFNIDSATTLKTNQAVDHQRAPQIMMQVLHQEMGPGNSHKQTPAQGGSVTEGVIKGRKIDNPHLVVVKELKEQEEFEETMRANHLKNAALPRRSRMQEDLLNMSLLNNSGFIGLQKPIQNPERQRNSKSQEHNPRRNKSRDRTAAAAHVVLKDNKSHQEQPKKSAAQVKSNKSGTKSSRENVHTTQMGLNELLIIDQQPIGYHHQAHNQVQADFKNRTHHEILKQATTGMELRQPKNKKVPKEIDSHPKNEGRDQSRSRSRDKKAIQQPIKILAQNLISAILPKSLAQKDKNIHQYNQHEPRKINSSSHAHTDASAEKKPSQFIQQQDLGGGRCVTSQGLANQSQLNLLSLNSNGGRTFSQPNLAKTTSKSSRYTLHTEPNVTEGYRQQSSPDRSIVSNSNNLLLQKVANMGIDKLVKQNLIKMRSKMEEEKMQRQVSEERLRKKKEMLDQSNHMVRKVNKDKTYHHNKQIANHHQYPQPNALGNQQSQDYVLSTSNPSTIDYPGANPKLAPRKFELKHLKQQLNIQKLSQSQKIDFALIKESSKNNKHQQIVNGIKINNHRKSYGLEFIDIKKEIQEELKTIEQRQNLYHYKDSIDAGVTVPSQDSNEPVISSIQFDYYQVPKRLKIKQASRQLDHEVQDSEMLDHHHNLTQSSFLDTSIAGCQGHQNNKTERGGSDEQQPSLNLDSDHQHHPMIVPRLDLDSATHQQPHQKILVVKKSKIRKFMKMKKREKQKEQMIQQNNEILKTIKMQENITRLNEFCKKNMQKNFHKKRNATIQQQPPYENIRTTGVVNNTKMSGRKIDFEEGGPESHQKNDQSSRLSTEFYEEYYNAIKALKNPGQSRQQAAPGAGGTSIKQRSSPTNKSFIIKSNGTHNQTLIMSPHEDKAADESRSKIHIPKPSKYQLSNTTGSAQLLKQKFKKPKTSKSRHPPAGIFQVHQNLLPISSTQQNIISTFIAKKKQRGNNQHGSQDRSESAPLYKKKNTSQTRLNNTNLNESLKHSSHGKNFKAKSSSQKQSKGLLEIELELMHIYLTKQAIKIQRAYRRHLQSLGFYDQDTSTVMRQPITTSQSQLLIHTTEEQEETVRREAINDAANHRTLDYQITDGELAECPDTTLQPPQGHQQEDDFEYDEEEEEESEGDNNPQLIIINQDQLLDDDKKVVYLSNINSCSLPQTPKLDDEDKPKQQQPSIQNTFDYIAHKNGFILEQINNRRGSQINHISQSSSVADVEEQSVIQNPIVAAQQEIDNQGEAYSYQEDEDPMNIEELKNHDANDEERQAQDYGMRMLTGSQSLLREIKMASTPRDQRNISSAFKDMFTIQRSITQSACKRNLTSHHSEQSLQTIQVQPANNLEQYHQTNTTSSHQSIFDRNSFQNFTAQKLQDMIRNNEFLNLISMRERALDYRQDKERRNIKKLYKARQMSPRTYTEKKEQLERWVRLEQDDIHRTKVQYQQEWDKAVKMIEDTQKNVMHIKEQIFTQDITENHHHGKQGGGLLSSRNSSASQLYNTQQSYQKNGKSILEQEEYQPIMSHRLLQSQGSVHKSNERQNINTTIGYSNQQEQTKPTLFKSHLATLDERAVGGAAVQPPDGTTLMDFLEESWQKTQVSINKQTITQPPPASNPNRIFIQDQHSVDYNESSLPVSPGKTSEEETIEHQEEEESRTLMRSRPEQDLSELLKKNHPDHQIEGISRDIEMLDADESFRLLDSERQQQNLNSQIHIVKKTTVNDDIRIQENLFDDSSQRQLSSPAPQHNVSHQLHQLEHELPSQTDSLLNEQELNQYFNEEHKGGMKFSIEDFKQLDKCKLLLARLGPDGANPTESARSHFDVYDDDDELISRNGGGYVQSARDTELKQEDGIMAEEKQITLESNQSISIPDHEGGSSNQIQFNQGFNHPLQLMKVSSSSEPELTPLPQTSSFLFQNAKPGENIKIADILRKNTQQQQYFHHTALQVQQSPSPVSNTVENEKEQIVFEIAEDILRMLLDEQVQFPLVSNSPPNNTTLSTFKQNLEASPEYSLIVPQRIEGVNGGQQDPTIPMFTFDALELDEINLEHKPQQQPLVLPPISQNAQNQDVFLVDNSFNEKEQRRELIDLRQRMLIESDLSRIEAYINEIINTLQQHELNYLEGMSGCLQPQIVLVEPNFHRQFLQVLTVPIKRSQLDVLNHLQTSEIGSYEHFETAMDIASHPILPVDLYLDIERQREEQHLRILSSCQQLDQQQQDVNIENSVIQESVHIHNKGIFDALNESLMKFRPYGIQGEPMPWSNKVRRLQTKVDTSQVDTERLFFMVKQDVMRWASNCVGCLPSQIFMARRSVVEPHLLPPQFDDEIFQETRERRLAQMLASEVVETEHQWLNYEFEESQIKIDLSDMILEQLVEEVVNCLQLHRQAQEDEEAQQNDMNNKKDNNEDDDGEQLVVIQNT